MCGVDGCSSKAQVRVHDMPNSIANHWHHTVDGSSTAMRAPPEFLRRHCRHRAHTVAVQLSAYSLPSWSQNTRWHDQWREMNAPVSSTTFPTAIFQQCRNMWTREIAPNECDSVSTTQYTENGHYNPVHRLHMEGW